MALFLAYDVASNPLNTNEWAFPVCEVLHILGFAVGIGTIAMVNVRLLGLGLKKESPADLWKGTFPWTLAGLVYLLVRTNARRTTMSSTPRRRRRRG